MKAGALLFGFSLSLILLVSAQRPCVEKKFPGARNNVVCVCNATYCDDVPSVGTFSSNQAVVIKSSIKGDRLSRNVITFGTKQKLTKRTKAETLAFKLNASKQYQQIIGFGGAFTDSTGINLNKLSPKVSNDIIRQYYSKNGGIGYTIGRIPMASCDFSTHEYSYDDVDSDFDLVHFNLTQEDLTLKIPYVLQAQKFIAADDEFKLFSSPWSAPAWMKTNGHMRGGGELKGEKNGQYYKTWANYFLKFFELYAKQGITFWGTTIQNEPSSGLDPLYKWQTMSLTAEMERDFLAEILGPALKASNLSQNLKIMIYEDQRVGIKEYVEKVMEKPEAAKFVDGIAYHWYEDYLSPASGLSVVHDAFPSLFQLNTEACTGYLPFLGGVSLGDWSRGGQYIHSMIEDIQNFGAGWVDWNLILDLQGGPNWVGNYVDAPIILSNTTDEYYKNPMFYALAHMSAYVRPGSYRIQLTDSSGEQPTFPVEAVAFTNSQSQRIVVLNNREDSDHQVTIEDAQRPGEVLTINMEQNSIVTLIWNKA